MLKLKKHHAIVITLLVVTIIAWSVWTFLLLPRSETPNLPVPVAPASVPTPK